NARITRPGGRVLVDVPQTFHLYTVMKNTLILANRWFAGWETQFTVGQLERLVRESGLEVVRSYGGWMVPGVWYRVLRELGKRGLGARLPLHPRGPGWWARGWDDLRARLRTRRWALHTCHVIGTVGRRPPVRCAVTCWRSTTAILRTPRRGAPSCTWSRCCSRPCAAAGA